MLRERYAKKCSQGSEDSAADAVRGDGRRGSTDTSGEEGRAPRRGLGPSQESYRKAIRGNTDHITRLYDENNDGMLKLRSRPTNRKRLARMTDKLCFSVSDAPVAAGHRIEGGRFGGVGKALSKSWIGESRSNNLESLLFDDNNTCHIDAIKDDKTDHFNHGVEGSAELHDTGEHHSVIQNSSSHSKSSSDNSDDDRSNNGQFEYYPVLKPTKKEVLERRKSYRKNDKGECMRQSLPPKCERFIGIVQGVDNLDRNEESVVVDKKALCHSLQKIHIR